MKSKRSKACDILQKVKEAVWERDGHRCIICHSRIAMPNAHFIPRSKGGLGIEENIVTLCTNFSECKCHYKFDFGNRKVSKFDTTVIVQDGDLNMGKRKFNL